MTQLRSCLLPLVILAILGQFAPLAVCRAATGPATTGTSHTSECTCEADTHDPMCPMHRHMTPAGYAATSADGSCHIRGVMPVALPGAGLVGIPQPAFSWHAPLGAHVHADAPAALVGRRPVVELRPPRA